MDKLTPYTYYAKVVKVSDGDSAKVDIDLGLGIIKKNVGIRLLGCNAPELKQEGGPEAKQALANYLPAGTKVLLQSVKCDKFGSRLDADVWMIDHAGQQLPEGNVVQLLAAKNHVALWSGKGERPVPTPAAPSAENLPA
jgi:endonuclease YncB( thermonuclease family)